jgi:6-pyruvoyltetrahydropterin/6-carboxytetrahydropterin synthase
MITVSRFHDISAGHRVHGHESVCAHLHGHNYRISFTVGMNARFAKPGTALDSVGRVIDFSVIKSKLCVWLDNNWDHKMLISYKDPIGGMLIQVDPNGICIVPFNPTAENMASYLLNIIGPQVLENENVQLIEVHVEETRKCSATASIDFVLEERS